MTKFTKLLIKISFLTIAFLIIISQTPIMQAISPDQLFALTEVGEYQIVHLATFGILIIIGKRLKSKDILETAYYPLMILTVIIVIAYVMAFLVPDQLYIIEVATTISTIANWIFLCAVLIKHYIQHLSDES